MPEREDYKKFYKIILSTNMPSYYVCKNAQSYGDHEVHQDDCEYFPESVNRIYLGAYSNCANAVLEAKTISIK